MIQRAVQGMALFHVDTDHDAGHDDHALILKLRRLRDLNLKHATIGQVRPVFRVYPRHGKSHHYRHGHRPSDQTKDPKYHYFIEVTADSTTDLENAFEQMELTECHVDGFGF